MLSEGDLSYLRDYGYVHLQCIDSLVSTVELARDIGNILVLGEVDAAYPSKEVDILYPKEKTSYQTNRYYGVFGFEEYPAHTDFAHWFIPPRYILLRALTGSQSVKTYIYPTKTLLDCLPENLAARALFVPRNAKTVTALTFNIPRCRGFTVRCDSIFIRPLNAEAEQCVEIFRSGPFLSKRKSIILSNPQHAIIIDNWRCLHGRSSVPASEKNRAVERIYLENIYGISG